MTLIRDLIPIPEAVHRGDFVLNLAEGVQNPEETVGTYVVTDQLLDAFQQAVRFIRSAFPGTPDARPQSRAAYLHGSFGCGKSHFMAVLSLLLDGHPVTRQKDALLPVIAEHNWIEGKKFLLVPYHMIGKPSMEEAILGGYAAHVRRLHPEARVPGIYPADRIIADARRMRGQMGDEKFFGMLNEKADGDNGGAGWGEWEGQWDAASFDEAASAPGLHADKLRLVGDLSERVFSAVQGASNYVGLDDGLVIISQHAKDLGYDALVLFLDELILWLMSRAADLAFVQSEGQKLGILREGKPRALPIISFVARQRDLRDVLGDHLPGAERRNFADHLQWWEGRFDRIDLEDRNLPKIAQERLLKAKSPEAKTEIDEAFARTTDVRQEVMRTLLTNEGDRGQFRDLYPFSPALMQVLVAVSSALQRERTALKVLLQIMVDQRDSLELGQVVPVGDLWDVIAEGEEVFDPNMRPLMNHAKKLYNDKLRPLLLQEHGLPLDWDGKGAIDDPDLVTKRKNLGNDDRLVTTLLLSALVPKVESLRNLDPRRLAALNHGTIQSPIPGREPHTVLTKLRRWASHVGEIRLTGDQNNPSVSLQLTGVDTESILVQARGEDNEGNRKLMVQRLLFGALGIALEDKLFIDHTITWRGTQHPVSVLYMNVREANEENLRSPGDDWKIVIDYPFDRPGHTGADDTAKLQDFKRRQPDGARTIVWLPNFFTEAGLRDLGNLVVMDFVLSGERFSGYAAHLSPQDQQSARAILENQRAALREKMVSALEAAYGLHRDTMSMVESSDEETYADRFRGLLPGFDAQPPAATNLKDALQHLVEQALEHQYPGHPEFGIELKASVLRRVYEYASTAIASEGRRVPVDRARRTEMKAVAEPLRLGKMGDTHFAVGRHWVDHFEQQMAAEAIVHPTVRDLMRWMDRPRPCGLDDRVRFLAIKLFADMTDRSFYQYGAVVDETGFEWLDAEMELRDIPLPPEEVWKKASLRAGGLFGWTGPDVLNAGAVRQLSSDVQDKAQENNQAVRQLAEVLREAHVRADVEPGDSDRLRAATEVNALMASLQQAGEAKTVETLAGAELTADLVHLGKTIASAGEVGRAVAVINWEDLQSATGLPDPFGSQASRLLQEAQNALKSHELSSPLQSSLPSIQRQLTQLRDRERTAREDALERERKELEAAKKRLEKERKELEEKKGQEVKPSEDSFTVEAALADIDERLQEVKERLSKQPPESTVEIKVRVFGKKK